ncbi:MAG: ABC transporter permease [bacterium]|nr:ABC transporter permease [bacterium]
MLSAEIFQEALASLWQNKGRTFLSILGIVIGIASVITMMAIGSGSQAEITDSISSLGTNILTVSPRGWSGGGFTKAELETILANDYTGVFANYSPEVSTSQTLSANDTEETISLTGITANYFDTRSKELQLGRQFSESEIASQSKVIILGSDTAETFFGSAQASIGEKIKVGSSTYEVIGILKSSGGSSGTSQDTTGLIPITTAQNQLLGSNTYGTIAFSLKDVAQLEKAKSIVGYTLLDLHNLDSVDDADFSMMSATDLLETLTSVTETFTLLLAGIASISLLVGGIGIMNVMLMSVLERTQEIGLRKALGAKKKYLIMQFLFEAVLITFLGGLIGLLIGLIASAVLNNFTQLSAVISWNSVFLAISISTLIGLIFGIYPANKAAKLQPIEALRTE